MSNCTIIYYVKVYYNIFCHIVICHKLMYNTICFFCYHAVRNYKTLQLSYHNYIIPETSHFTQYCIYSNYTVFYIQHMLYNNFMFCFTYCFIFALYEVCLYHVNTICIIVFIIFLLSYIYHIFTYLSNAIYEHITSNIGNVTILTEK